MLLLETVHTYDSQFPGSNSIHPLNQNPGYFLLKSVYWQKDICNSFVVISDNLNSTKDSIIAFLDCLLTSLVESEVKTVDMWSDEPSSSGCNQLYTQPANVHQTC